MDGKSEMSSQITANLVSFSVHQAPATIPAPETAAPVVPAPAPAPGGFGVVQMAAPAPAPVPVSVSASGMGGASDSGGSDGKKKRGRPRKYAPDGSVSLALSPMPISSSIPLGGGAEFSAAWKRGRGRPVDAVKKSQRIEFDNPVAGERVSYFLGANFTPHMITVNAGEDIMMKVMSLSRQSSRAVCVLSAIGTISNVTLQQSSSSGGTLTYEGRFELLSLSGSYTPSGSGGTRSISGGMSVSLAGPDGRVVGGGLAGLLVAAGPVQVVVGSFLPGHEQEQKPKKQRIEYTQSFTTPTVVHTVYSEELKGTYGGTNQVAAPSSFQGNHMASLNPMRNMNDSNMRDSSADNNGSTHDGNSSPSLDQM